MSQLAPSYCKKKKKKEKKEMGIGNKASGGICHSGNIVCHVQNDDEKKKSKEIISNVASSLARGIESV